jgi:preprotein translocase subunit SecG
MTTIILIIHLILAISLVVVVLLQRSEGGGLGIGGGGGMMSGRAQANTLTRATAFIAAGFVATSLLLAILAGGYTQSRSILEQDLPASPLVPAPTQPQEPAAPLAQ